MFNFCSLNISVSFELKATSIVFNFPEQISSLDDRVTVNVYAKFNVFSKKNSGVGKNYP